MRLLSIVLLFYFNVNNLHSAELKKLVMGGGCFWCMEPPFEKEPGVISVVSGYTGGKKANPSYEEVSSGISGHREVVEVTYDAQKISLSRLLSIYWENVDPLDSYGQFCDKGDQYKSALYYADETERNEILKSKAQAESKLKIKSAIVTEVISRSAFYPAENYHQDYYKKNPVRYKFYRFNCGRDKRLEQLWP